MNDLSDKLAKWFRDGDKNMREQLRNYVFGLSFLKYKEKSRLWEQIMKKALK